MYLSKVHLTNWRSYGDAEFRFQKPSGRRPLVLVGAMNGHGKTSLLFSLYVGLFGRFGLRHAEGFTHTDGEDAPRYREAIRRFRRSTSTSDEPTSVELVFTPTAKEEGSEIRIIRRWFFSSFGSPKSGDAFETLELYLDDKPQKLHTGLDAAIPRLERFLFRADVMPAFFFDGEQAQTLINNSGQDGMKKAVEVLFGTRVVEEALDATKQFIQLSHSKLGGKKNADSQQVQLDEKIQVRDALESEIVDLEKTIRSLEKKRESLETDQRHNQEALSKLGGERRDDLVQIHAAVDRAETEKRNAEKSLTESARKMGIALALSRLATSVANRLNAEAARERWENVRDGTIQRSDEVLQLALPEPHSSDPILHDLDAGNWSRLRDRFKAAIERIYIPPPNDCAAEYILGHVRGESRDRLMMQLNVAKGQSVADIRGRAKRLTDARQQLEDAVWRRERIGTLPEEVEKISEKLSEIGEQISETSRQLGAAENEVKKRRAELRDLNAEIGRFQELLAKLGPEQKRIAVAERARTVLSSLSEQLRPITVERLQDSVTSHFVRIADKRYQKGKIVFPESGAPVLRRPNAPDALIEMMSGFERRSFGIAFSLALAEITQKRVPLVIDTPLGNADQGYRRRLLKALMNVDLDQVIILTHDAEVAGSVFEEIEGQVRQYFLVEFDQNKQESVVYPDRYFDGIGR
ncbi:AAA family ATPase [Aquisphaera insulae]|uniref:AAA family ATPase n=1 Tax=Aquisphaera insulae TaxID=2712864 RepID=UPI0013ED95B1|nr:AAA family ATPase [Aquisphaera insulae]